MYYLIERGRVMFWFVVILLLVAWFMIDRNNKNRSRDAKILAEKRKIEEKKRADLRKNLDEYERLEAELEEESKE